MSSTAVRIFAADASSAATGLFADIDSISIDRAHLRFEVQPGFEVIDPTYTRVFAASTTKFWLCESKADGRRYLHFFDRYHGTVISDRVLGRGEVTDAGVIYRPEESRTVYTPDSVGDVSVHG